MAAWKREMDQLRRFLSMIRGAAPTREAEVQTEINKLQEKCDKLQKGPTWMFLKSAARKYTIIRDLSISEFTFLAVLQNSQ